MEMQSEIDSLRELVERQKTQIEALSVHFIRMQEADLNQLAARGASDYCEAKCKGMPTVDRQLVLNAIAHGIYMGYRKKESHMGILKPKSPFGIAPDGQIEDCKPEGA